jgi:TRAP-type C4-dicarboxylate transport system substrate-binding protein
MTRTILPLMLIALMATPAMATTTLKMGTLAPAKSSWMKMFLKAANEIKTLTGGAVRVKIYPGGSQGDEKRAVDKMRSGQLQMAAVTAVGLAEIAKEVLVLQAPDLITSYRTLDKVRNKLKSRFEGAMTKKGFVLLGWGDVGLTYVYSKQPVVTPADLKKTKFWVWRDDPIVKNLARVAGARGVPLGVPGVLPALSTGAVNALLASPLACLQLQWCNHMTHRNPTAIQVGVGAVVVRSTVLNGLSPEHQKIVKDTFHKWTSALVSKVRRDNSRATLLLRKKRGIIDTPVTAAQKAAWKAAGRKVQQNLAGTLYPVELLNQVRGMAQ